MKKLDRLLKANGNRVLILFCSMMRVLDLIVEFCHYNFSRLDRGTEQSERTSPSSSTTRRILDSAKRSSGDRADVYRLLTTWDATHGCKMDREKVQEGKYWICCLHCIIVSTANCCQLNKPNNDVLRTKTK